MGIEKLAFFLMFPLFSSACVKMMCGENTAPMCYNYTAATNSATVSPCAQGYICSMYLSTSEQSGSCIVAPVTYYAVPGNLCNSKNQCEGLLVDNCVDGVCQGLEQNSHCKFTIECNPGLYCKALNSTYSTCQPLLLPGADCSLATDLCTYQYTCNFGKCVKMYSFKIGSLIDAQTCTASYSYACEKTACGYYDSTHSICVNPFVSQAPYDTVCETCIGVSNTNGKTYFQQKDCYCGYGGSYCQGFGGDPYGAQSKELYLEYLSTGLDARCNIAGSFLTCMQDYWDPQKYREFFYYFWRNAERWRVVEADPCVVEILDPVTFEVFYGNESFESSYLKGMVVGFVGILVI